MSAEGERELTLTKHHIFTKFLEVNINLLECYAQYSDETKLQAMTKKEMDATCGKEKADLKKFMDSNEMTMGRIVSERLEVLE